MSFIIDQRHEIAFVGTPKQPAVDPKTKIHCDHCNVDFTPKRARACIRVRCPIRRLLPK